MLMQRSARSALFVGLVGSVALVAQSCGDDETASPAAGGTGGTGAPTGTTGGAGGATGTGGAGGATGTGGAGGATGTGGTGATVDAGVADVSAAEAPVDAVATLSDPIIAGVVVELNMGEVAAGQLAEMRASDDDVEDFAMMMVAEHSAANMRAMALAQRLNLAAADSSVRQMVRMKGEAVLAMLRPLSDAAFDRAYMASQVMMHMDALQLLESQLIPAAQAPDLRTELMMMRTAVVAHLAEARELHAAVAGGDGGSRD
jgi:putative membrane protein